MIQPGRLLRLMIGRTITTKTVQGKEVKGVVRRVIILDEEILNKNTGEKYPAAAFIVKSEGKLHQSVAYHNI